jgi:hypothetical protein
MYVVNLTFLVLEDFREHNEGKSEAKAWLMLFVFVIFELYYILCLWFALPIVLHRLFEAD